MNSSSVDEDVLSTHSTALVEACINRDYSLVDLLLKYGARDDECKALFITIQNKDETLTTKLLSVKVIIITQNKNSFITKASNYRHIQIPSLKSTRK